LRRRKSCQKLADSEQKMINMQKVRRIQYLSLRTGSGTTGLDPDSGARKTII
jgi:hypothetical protein